MLIFSGRLCLPEALNKDPTVWLHLDKPANTNIPPSFAGKAPVQQRKIPTLKNTFASIKNFKIW
jgi:hypothetical protein